MYDGYGIWCMFTGIKPSSEKRTFRNVKHRPLTKAFQCMCADLEQMQEIAEVDDRAKKVIEGFMPGPLTVILKRKMESIYPKKLRYDCDSHGHV